MINLRKEFPKNTEQMKILHDCLYFIPAFLLEFAMHALLVALVLLLVALERFNFRHTNPFHHLSKAQCASWSHTSQRLTKKRSRSYKQERSSCCTQRASSLLYPKRNKVPENFIFSIILLLELKKLEVAAIALVSARPAYKLAMLFFKHRWAANLALHETYCAGFKLKS